MPNVDQERHRTGRPRYTDEQLKEIADNPFPDPPSLLGPQQIQILFQWLIKIRFIKKRVAVILESRSGWIAVVRGFARPGAKKDVYDRNATLNHLPIVAVTPDIIIECI